MMKSKKLFFNLMILALFIFQFSGLFAKSENEAIKSIFLKIDEAYAKNDLEQVLTHFSQDFSSGAILDREKLEARLGKFFEAWEDISLKTNITKLNVVKDNAVVVTEATVKATKKDSKEKLDMTGSTLNFLQKENGIWKIGSYQKLEFTNGMISGDNYTDKKLGYSISKLSDWEFYKIEITGQPLILSSLIVLSPDISSSVTIGLIELPTAVSAQQAVEGDEAVTKSMASDYKLISKGWKTLKAGKAYEGLSEFTVKDKPIKRRRLYFAEDKLVVFILCDSPIELFPKVESEFDKIVNSFSFLNRDEESIRDRVAGQMAKGSISQNIYSNSEYGFQIAKPTTWKMSSTSTKLLFQITITAPDEKSYVMFGAVKLPIQASAKDVVMSEEKATQNVAESYTLISEQEAIIGGEPGYETVTQFGIGGMDRKRKRAYFVKDNIAYFFVCDALPPSRFNEYTNDFDSIINSLTWN